MAPKPIKKKPRTVTIEFPSGQFATVLFANRVGTERIGGNWLVHLGCVREVKAEEELLAAYVCMFDAPMLAHEKESWLGYLQDVGLPESESDMSWRVPLERIREIPHANAVQWARRDDQAEMRCYNFAIGDVVMGEGPEKITAQPLALVRSSVSLQQQLILALYAEL